MTGYFYKVDWRTRQVVAKMPVAPFKRLVGSRGGSRGGRGLAFYNNRLYAATFDKILVYNPKLELRDIIFNQYVIGHHEIQVDDTGIWCCSTPLDGVIKLSHTGDMIDGVFLGERKLLARNGTRVLPRDRSRNYLAEAEMDESAVAHFDEQYHVNTVTSQANGETHAFCCNYGYLLSVKPRLRFVAIMPQLVSAHNVQVVGDYIFANNTLAKCFEIYARSKPKGPPLHRIEIHGPEAGQSRQFATEGWVRGMCWLSDDLLVVGTSPASLVSINLRTFKIEDRMTLETDVRHAVHDLCSAPM